MPQLIVTDEQMLEHAWDVFNEGCENPTEVIADRAGIKVESVSPKLSNLRKIYGKEAVPNFKRGRPTSRLTADEIAAIKARSAAAVESVEDDDSAES